MLLDKVPKDIVLAFRFLSDLDDDYLVRNKYFQRQEGDSYKDKRHPKSEGDADGSLGRPRRSWQMA